MVKKHKVQAVAEVLWYWKVTADVLQAAAGSSGAGAAQSGSDSSGGDVSCIDSQGEDPARPASRRWACRRKHAHTYSAASNVKDEVEVLRHATNGPRLLLQHKDALRALVQQYAASEPRSQVAASNAPRAAAAARPDPPPPALQPAAAPIGTRS